jgi:hypothetical protein
MRAEAPATARRDGAAAVAAGMVEVDVLSRPDAAFR